MDSFLGQGSTFWTGVAAISSCAYTALVTLTLWLLIGQVRIAARTFRLDAIRRLQDLVDEFRDDRRTLFNTLPLAVAVADEQFAMTPPGRGRIGKLSEGEVSRMALTPAQTLALASLTSDQKDLAQRVIGKLNDIGQLVEDGLVDKRVFLGKYHVMVIQVCHLVEAVRRQREVERGGNYGQRLLRMRKWATSYNDVHPKHRQKAIQITCPSGNVSIYHSPEVTIGRWTSWTLRRLVGHYG